jgi:GNAT superfamily N-acetyltransferase
MRVEMNTLTASLFLDLYASVDWELPCKEQVEAALQNTLITFTAYEDNQAVGMVRLLGDGGMSFYVKDFAVIPSRQRQGIGSALMSAIREYIISRIQPGWAVSLELISTKEAVSFYKRQGFEERPCDWDGPGMFKMIQNIGDAKHAGD